jgi:hypothetical protein
MDFYGSTTRLAVETAAKNQNPTFVGLKKSLSPTKVGLRCCCRGFIRQAISSSPVVEELK